MLSPDTHIKILTNKRVGYLEGKNYPTSSFVLPSMYGCIKQLSADVPTPQPWDGKLLQPIDLRPEVVAGRKVLHDNM